MTTWKHRVLGSRRRRSIPHGGTWANIALLAGAPATVIVVLHVTENVPAAFLAYHVAWCLLVPALVTFGKAGVSWRELGEALGLRKGYPRGGRVGLVAGVLMGGGLVSLFAWQGGVLLADADLRGQLAAWGVPAVADGALFVYMMVFNSVAEELYWRGFVYERLSAWSSRWRAIVVLTVFFTSFHVYTVFRLVEKWETTVLLASGVFVGGLVWVVLRERYDSVVPAALAHMGATAGYMSVYVAWT